MHRRAALILSIAAFAATAPLLAPSAWAENSTNNQVVGRGLYAQWTNGPWSNPNFFPIAVWWQAPVADAVNAAQEKMNIFLGISGWTGYGLWPEKFGVDSGEIEAIKANGLYLIGGINTPFGENTSIDSVASVLALAKSAGALSNLIGYQASDEPSCSGGSTQVNTYGYPPATSLVPTVVADIHSYDPTRVVTYNNTAWMAWPEFNNCLAASVTAFQATDIGSFDLYPLTRAWFSTQNDFVKSDFRSVANDTLFMQGVTVQAMAHYARPNQPLWAFIESGSNNKGYSEQDNVLVGTVTAGSKTLVNASNWSVFTPTWIGLTVSGPGIPAKTTITAIIDSTHATMSAAATGGWAKESITVTGGVENSDCVASVNLCVVDGNEFRPTPAQVNAEVWMSIINGANGIEYFCHDTTAVDFCLGSGRGTPSAASATTVSNLTYIDSTIVTWASILNSWTVGQCSMQQENYANGAYSHTSSCTNGSLTLATTNNAVPAAAMLKTQYGINYLFVQSDRRSPYGALLKMTVAGLAGHTAKVLYDSNTRYDFYHTSAGATYVLDATGTFSDTLGAHGDDYQVKIYQIK